MIDKEQKHYGATVTTNKNGNEFSDLELALYVKKHLRFRDRFNSVAISVATMIAFNVFLEEGTIESPRKNWKFFDKDTKFKWNEEL